jgi:hypothetical protein
MRDTFASVGATRFDVTWTRSGDKEWFRRGLGLADLAATSPGAGMASDELLSGDERNARAQTGAEGERR